MSESDKPVYDLSNKGNRRLWCEFIRTREGFYRIEITKCRDQRTQSQNAYYWGVVLREVAKAMTELNGEEVIAEEVHFFLKKEFLSKPIVNRDNGELVGMTAASSAMLDTAEFGVYIDKIKLFAAEKLGIEIPEPTPVEACDVISPSPLPQGEREGSVR